MHVLVTGASGFIGSAVVAEALAAGHRVTAVVRSRSGAELVSSLGAEPYFADLAVPQQLGDAAARADGVIHLAFGHGLAMADAVATDEQVITAIGVELAGTQRPFVVTSGTLVLPAGRVGVESDKPDPGAVGGLRGTAERVALDLAEAGVRVSVVRLAPSVHDGVRRGFAGALVDTARRSGLSGYLGDGRQRWPAVHRSDAARLYLAALTSAPAGAVLHGVGEPGVRLRAIAELIGQRLAVPVEQVAADRADQHFGWLATIAGTDAPASSAETSALLGWHPGGAGLLEDMSTGEFFASTAR